MGLSLETDVAVDFHPDRDCPRMCMDRSRACVTLFSLRGAVYSESGVPEASNDQKRSEDGKLSLGCHKRGFIAKIRTESAEAHR